MKTTYIISLAILLAGTGAFANGSSNASCSATVKANGNVHYCTSASGQVTSGKACESGPRSGTTSSSDSAVR